MPAGLPRHRPDLGPRMLPGLAIPFPRAPATGQRKDRVVDYSPGPSHNPLARLPASAAASSNPPQSLILVVAAWA